MTTVLQTLFLRRPRIEYVSSPVCPIHFSASGVAFFDNCFADQTFCSALKINTNFLNFQEPSDGLAYNIYYSTQESGQPFQLIIDGLAPHVAVLFQEGTYWFTVNTPAGESIPFPPTVAPGGMYVQVPIPQTSDAISWNLYQDGTKIISSFTGSLVESSAEGWYQATKITTDGETPLSGCSALLLSGTGPLPPPPPPPAPGPNWLTGFSYGLAVCNACSGEILNGTPVCSGGLLPPAGSFSMHTQLVGGAPFEFIRNASGFVNGFYTGPDCHVRLTLVGSSAGPGSISSDNVVTLLRNSVNAFQISGAAMYVSGNYDFFLQGGVGVPLQLVLQGMATANQSLTISGTFSNIP